MLLKRWDSHDRNAYAPKFHIRLNLDSNKNWHSKTVYIESWIGVNLFPVVDSQALSMKEKKKKDYLHFLLYNVSFVPVSNFGFWFCYLICVFPQCSGSKNLVYHIYFCLSSRNEGRTGFQSYFFLNQHISLLLYIIYSSNNSGLQLLHRIPFIETKQK